MRSLNPENGEIMLNKEIDNAYNDNFYRMGYVSYNLLSNNKQIMIVLAFLVVLTVAMILLQKLSHQI